jgi:hypothetical protein
MIWKIWKKSKLISEKIWKMRKKNSLNCEMIQKIWKKSKLCALNVIAQRVT